jgi:hypothetical protein
MRPISELLEFLEHTMKMQKVYQPVVILNLLKRGGTSSIHDLAQRLAAYDDSVQEKYQRILMKWPKTTLMKKHKVVSYDPESASFTLNFDLADSEKVDRAKEICIEKIKEWKARRKAKHGRQKNRK